MSSVSRWIHALFIVRHFYAVSLPVSSLFPNQLARWEDQWEPVVFIPWCRSHLT